MKDNVELQKQHFSNISARYIEARSGENHIAYKGVIWKFILKKLAEYLPQRSHMIGLEAMCGNAEAARRIANYFPSITMRAFDLSNSMVAAAKETDKSRIDIFEGDILKFDQKETYDLIAVIGGLHHIPDYVQKGLQNIHNALKEGGIFLNLEPTHNNFLWEYIRRRIYKNNSIFEENSEQGFTLEEYNRYLTKNNFRILYQFYPGLLGYVLYYNPDAFPALNKGSTGVAELMAKIDILLGKSFIGEIFSFATWVIAEKR